MNNVSPASIVGINPGSAAMPPPTTDDDFADFQAAEATGVPPSGNWRHAYLLEAALKLQTHNCFVILFSK